MIDIAFLAYIGIAFLGVIVGFSLAVLFGKVLRQRAIEFVNWFNHGHGKV